MIWNYEVFILQNLFYNDIAKEGKGFLQNIYVS